MCLIIHVDKGLPDVDLMKSAHVNNSMGFGLMYLDDNNRVVTDKIMPKEYDDIDEVLSRHPQDIELGLHFRLSTAGKTNAEMAHPFQVLSYDKHGRDLWLMHNGPRLPVPILEDDKSDTWHFVKHMLYPILENNPDFIENDDFIRMLDRIIGSEKLLLLDSHVGFIRVNENAGTKKDNMWLSNTYSLGRDKGMNYNVHTGKVVPSKAPVTNLYGNKGKSLVPYGNRNWIEADYVGDDDDYLYPELGHNWGKVADYSTKADRLEVIGNSTLPDLYGDPAPVSTEEILDAYTSNTLYEFALDNLEGLVSWLRQTIKLPKAS